MNDPQALIKISPRAMTNSIEARCSVKVREPNLKLPPGAVLDDVQDVLKTVLLAPWGTVFDNLSAQSQLLPSDVYSYSFLTFEARHNIELR